MYFVFIIVMMVFAAITAFLLLTKTGQTYESNTLDELGEPSKKVEGWVLEGYRSLHCNHCKCYDSDSDECHCTLHWGKYGQKARHWCIINGSFERNKKFGSGILYPNDK